jgi:hypothetical protein
MVPNAAGVARRDVDRSVDCATTLRTQRDANPDFCARNSAQSSVAAVARDGHRDAHDVLAARESSAVSHATYARNSPLQ